MAMNKTIFLSAALAGALVIAGPAVARDGGGGGGGGHGGGGGGGSTGGASHFSGAVSGPSMSGGRMNGTFNAPSSGMRPSGNQRSMSGTAGPNWHWNSAENFNHRGHDHGHDHFHHRHSAFFPFGAFAYDYGYYDYPYEYPYEDCYVRRIKVHGHWVRRRYCEY